MIPFFLLEKENQGETGQSFKNKLSFIDKTLKKAADFVTITVLQGHISSGKGFFQKLDGRVKVCFLFMFVVLTSITGKIELHCTIAFFLFLLFIISKVNLVSTYRKILIFGFFFGFLVFAPSALNIFNKGNLVFTLFSFEKTGQIWIYKIPKEIYITDTGIANLTKLTLKVINSLTVVFLVIYTTSFERIVKSLSFYRIPDIFLLTLTLSYKFIFILSQTITETYLSLKMRLWGNIRLKQSEEIVTGRIGYLFRKSHERYEMVFQSMTARGYNGTANFHYFEKLKITDYIFSICMIVFVSIIIYFNSFYV